MRDLTERQHRKMDRVSKDDPHARVIGWVETNECRGPIIAHRGGESYAVNVTGYPKKLEDGPWPSTPA